MRPVAVGAVLTAVVAAGCAPPTRVAASGWHLAWRAESVAVTSTTATTSCRYLARLSGFGSQIRAEFTSTPGSRGYTIAAASLAAPARAGALDIAAGSSRPLTFAGRPGVLVRGGTSVLSDPLPVAVLPGSSVVVTVTAGAGDAPVTVSRPELSSCANGQPLNAATAPETAFPVVTGVRWLRSLMVDGPAQRSIVALGDSITERTGGSVTGGYDRWTDRVSDTGVVIANAGVSGGALGRPGLFGTVPATTRASALLAEPNVTDLVILLGTNDLDLGSSGPAVLGALDNVLAQARSRGVTAWVGTILPRANPQWSAYQEREREFVNAWLKTVWLTSRGGRLIDTEAAVRDPSVPTRLRLAYDSGDHLHPNAAGEAALAAAVLKALGPIRIPVVPPVPTPTPTSPTPPSPTPVPTESPVPTEPVPTESPVPTEPVPTETPVQTESSAPAA